MARKNLPTTEKLLDMVDRMAAVMKARIRSHRHQDDVPVDIDELQASLVRHVDRLLACDCPCVDNDGLYYKIAMAADVANLALMIAIWAENSQEVAGVVRPSLGR